MATYMQNLFTLVCIVVYNQTMCMTWCWDQGKVELLVKSNMHTYTGKGIVKQFNNNISYDVFLLGLRQFRCCTVTRMRI